MKIVIDIPEEVYESIQDNDYCGISNSDMYNAIKNGTPLSAKTTINPEETELKLISADGDLISRQAVLDRWEELSVRGRTEFDQAVMMLPSVPRTENVATWVELDDYPNEDWECDHCGFIITGIEEPYRFCPNCGKKMWK